MFLSTQTNYSADTLSSGLSNLGLSPGWGHCQLCGHGPSAVHVLHRVIFFFYLIFNSMAMGRAWFTFCMGFILLSFLTAWLWAERGSCSARGFFISFFFNWVAMGQARFIFCTGFIFIYLFIFLTMQPWAERGSCFARGLFIYLFIYLFIFVIFVGNQTQTSTRPSRGQDFESRNL